MDSEILSDEQITLVIESALRARAPEPVSEDELNEIVQLFYVQRCLHAMVLNGELDVTLKDGELFYVRRRPPFESDRNWILLSEEPLTDLSLEQFGGVA